MLLLVSIAAAACLRFGVAFRAGRRPAAELEMDYDLAAGSFSRRRRASPRGLLAVKLTEVRVAVTPWSVGRTRYDFSNRVCGSATMAECSAAASSSTSPAGCSSMCRVFQNDCGGFGRWLIQEGLGPHGVSTYATFQGQMRRRESLRRRAGSRTWTLAVDYYEAFTESFTPNVTWADVSKPLYPWHRLERLTDAMSGDFIVWRYADYETGTTGHMVVMDSEPYDLGNGLYRVLIADSALSGHSAEDDTRKTGGCSNGECGVGFGSMFFGTDSGGRIQGYQWSSANGTLQTDVDFAIGRFNPEDFY